MFSQLRSRFLKLFDNQNVYSSTVHLVNTCIRPNVRTHDRAAVMELDRCSTLIFAKKELEKNHFVYKIRFNSTLNRFLTEHIKMLASTEACYLLCIIFMKEN